MHCCTCYLGMVLERQALVSLMWGHFLAHFVSQEAILTPSKTASMLEMLFKA